MYPDGTLGASKHTSRSEDIIPRACKRWILSFRSTKGGIGLERCECVNIANGPSWLRSNIASVRLEQRKMLMGPKAKHSFPLHFHLSHRGSTAAGKVIDTQGVNRLCVAFNLLLFQHYSTRLY